MLESVKKNSHQGRLFIAKFTFGATPVFSSTMYACFYTVKYDVFATLVGVLQSLGNVREFLGAWRVVTLIRTVCELNVCISAASFNMCNCALCNRLSIWRELTSALYWTGFHQNVHDCCWNWNSLMTCVRYFANDDIVNTLLFSYILMCYADECFCASTTVGGEGIVFYGCASGCLSVCCLSVRCA